VKTFGAGKRL